MIMIAKRSIYDTHGKKAVERGSYTNVFPTVDPGFLIVETPGEPDYEIKVPASWLVAE